VSEKNGTASSELENHIELLASDKFLFFIQNKDVPVIAGTNTNLDELTGLK